MPCLAGLTSLFCHDQPLHLPPSANSPHLHTPLPLALGLQAVNYLLLYGFACLLTCICLGLLPNSNITLVLEITDNDLTDVFKQWLWPKLRPMTCVSGAFAPPSCLEFRPKESMMKTLLDAHQQRRA